MDFGAVVDGLLIVVDDPSVLVGDVVVRFTLRVEALHQALKSWIALEDVVAHSPPDAAARPLGIAFQHGECAPADLMSHETKGPFAESVVP